MRVYPQERSRYLDMRTPEKGTYDSSILGRSERTRSNGSRRWTNDTVGRRWADNPFSSTQWKVYRPSFTGEFEQLYNRKTLTSWPPINMPDPVSCEALFGPPFTEVERESMLRNIAARTNPSTAHLSIPTIIGEGAEILDLSRSACDLFKSGAVHLIKARNSPVKVRSLLGVPNWLRLAELPRFVFARGLALLNAVAAGNITWRFAMRPMLSDLEALYHFQSAVRQRWLWLDSLRRTGAIRRRVLLGEDIVEEHPYGAPYCCESATVVCYVQKFLKAQRRRWATAKWTLNFGADFPTTSEKMLAKGQMLALGITRFELLKAAWELTPWSWLLDWFTNVGSFLDVHNQSIPVHLESICLMQSASTRTRYEVVSLSPSSCSHDIGRQFEQEVVKYREVPDLLPAWLPALPSVPALDSGQWSILGSLATLKMGRSRLWSALRKTM